MKGTQFEVFRCGKQRTTKVTTTSNFTATIIELTKADSWIPTIKMQVIKTITKTAGKFR